MGGRLKLGQILISKGLLDPEQLAAALGEQERWGSRLGMTLVRMGFIEEEGLIRVLAAQLRLPVVRMGGKTVAPQILEIVPVELAEKYRCLPLFRREEAGTRWLLMAMEDPSDEEAVKELSARIGEKLRPVLVAPTELEDALQRHYHVAALMPETAGLAPMHPSSAEPVPEEPDTETEPQLPPTGSPMDPNLEAPSPESRLDELGDHPMHPGVEEHGLADLEDVPFGGDGEAFHGDAPTQPEPEPGFGPARPVAAGPAVEPQVLLQALAQLLVEKGVISRDEFADRLRRLAARTR